MSTDRNVEEQPDLLISEEVDSTEDLIEPLVETSDSLIEASTEDLEERLVWIDPKQLKLVTLSDHLLSQ